MNTLSSPEVAAEIYNFSMQISAPEIGTIRAAETSSERVSIRGH
jgi:hypothetical protein